MLKVVCSLLAVLASAAGVWAEEPVHFHDANLQAAVEAALGKSDPTPTDMLALTEFRAADRDIADLTGLERASNLQELDLNTNQISDLAPLAGLTNLTDLILRGNDISDLSPLAGLTLLTGLDIDWNEVTDISPLAGLTELTWLEMELNQVSDISPLAGLTNLTDADLERNRISDLAPLAGLTHLMNLDLEGNPISDLGPLAGLTNLANLDLLYDEISDLSPLAGLTKLESLALPGNRISDLGPLAGLTRLTQLSLSENQIDDISALADLTHLTHLYLDDNQISDISPLTGLTSLALVLLQENPLDSDACTVYIPQILANNPGVKVYSDSCGGGCTLTIWAAGPGSVTDPGEGTFEYERGTIVPVVALADSGGTFTGWTGTAVDAGQVADPGAATTTVTVDNNYTLQASFEGEGGASAYELTVSAGTGGSVSTPGEGVFTYDSITTVSIAARAYTGYRFSRWTGTAVTAGKVASPTAASTTVVVDGCYTLSATFTRSSSLSVRVLAPNGGESLAADSTFSIGWQVQGDIRTVSVEFTADGGSTWRRLSLCDASESLYAWAVPAVDSERCLIRVTADDNAGIADTSDAFFRIHKPAARIWYVDAAAAGTQDGNDWRNAFVHLQDALARAGETEEIHVAEGWYRPDLGGGQTLGDRAATFQLKKGVAIYGGFPTGGGTWSQRDPFLHPSILSGDIGKPEVASDNSFHVVTAGGTDKTTILDGCLIWAGFASGPEPQERGAGLYNLRGSPAIRNCTFVGNTALAGDGGGACNIESRATFTNCVFNSNVAGNCGGGMDNEGGAVQLVNCTFTGNQGLFRAGGVFCPTGTTTLANCILWDNGRQSRMRYDELAQVAGDAVLVIDYCCLQGWSGSFGGEGNWGGDPLFVDADGPDNLAGTPDDDLRLAPNSPAIDAGHNAAVGPATATDLQGQPRITGPAVDLGPYESESR